MYWLGLETPLGITAIEWPDRLVVWPQNRLSLKLAHAADGRTATLTASGIVPQWQYIAQKLEIDFTT
jgi:tRNA A37 threonylcarbamoyladenosine biosynthesis protein TsaE